MYANGAAGSFDAVGWHPYNYPYGLGYANWSAWSQMSETSPSARSLMTANGDGGKQIWATEFGAPTGSASNEESEAAQAQLVPVTVAVTEQPCRRVAMVTAGRMWHAAPAHETSACRRAASADLIPSYAGFACWLCSSSGSLTRS